MMLMMNPKLTVDDHKRLDVGVANRRADAGLEIDLLAVGLHGIGRSAQKGVRACSLLITILHAVIIRVWLQCVWG